MKLLNHYFAALLISFVLILPANSNANDGALKATTAVGDTLGAFNAGFVTPTPDRALFGVIYIDDHYYITGADPDAGWKRKIYKISGDGQELIDFSTLPDSLILLKGLTYDGEYMYAAGLAKIYQIDLETLQPTGVTIAAPIYYSSGLAYDPETDHFWVSGDGSQIFEINRNGNIVNIISFLPDLPTAGIAWDTWSIGGPYLWVWSMKYEPDDVRPLAYQIKASTGQFTGISFEGILTNQFGVDQAISLSMSDQVIDGKVAFIAMQGSNYQTPYDGLDWVVLYDLDPEGTGIPGPIINVNPTFIQNNLFFNDSIEVDVTISNLSDQYNLNWLATLEYPENEMNPPGEVLLEFNGTELASSITENTFSSVVFLNDFLYIISRPGPGTNAFLLKISADGSSIISSVELYFSSYGGSALATDGTYLYATSQYVILKINPDPLEVVGNIVNTNFSPNAMAIDPQNELLYLAGSNAMKVINMQGQEVNFYLLSTPPSGLAWDNWSPGGPFLWVYINGENGPIAYRTHPQTGMQTGVSFEGTNFSSSGSLTDIAGDIFVTPDWQQNKLVLIALQKSADSIGELSDRVVIYDLATIPPPGWIELTSSTVGLIEPLSSDILTVKLKAIMPDTLMTANVVINNNSIVNSRLVIPVAFLMEPDIQTNVSNLSKSPLGLIQNVFPNPATDQLKIQFNQDDVDGRIRIINNLGMEVYATEIRQNAGLFTLNIETLPAGIYHLIISDDTTVDQRSFFVR